MIQLSTPLGTPTQETKAIPRVWWPLSAVQRFTDSCEPCPEREYNPHERMCWRCGSPKIVCRCERGAR
jgi:hypothetical protein